MQTPEGWLEGRRNQAKKEMKQNRTTSTYENKVLKKKKRNQTSEELQYQTKKIKLRLISSMVLTLDEKIRWVAHDAVFTKSNNRSAYTEVSRLKTSTKSTHTYMQRKA